MLIGSQVLHDCRGHQNSNSAESIAKQPIRTARMKWFLQIILSSGEEPEYQKKLSHLRNKHM